MKITWLGHACFKIEKEGYAVLIDPYADDYVPGLSPVRERAEAVLCSHGHNDHNAKHVVQIEEAAEMKINVSTIDTYHDEVMGAKRGPNRIHILEDGECRVAHLGDLGCELEAGQLDQLRNLDAVMIPVGGFFTIDAKQAADLVARIQPRMVIPMHYRSDEDGYGYEVIGTVSEFTDCVRQAVVLETGTVDTEQDYGAQVVVLQPVNKISK